MDGVKRTVITYTSLRLSSKETEILMWNLMVLKMLDTTTLGSNSVAFIRIQRD